MIDYEEALGKVLEKARLLPVETVPLSKALGRTLGRPVRADQDVPPFDKATMDGYAVRASETRIPPDVDWIELDVAGDLPAGRTSAKPLKPGQALRIMTGAPLPRGADAVVMVEDTESAGSKVRIFRGVRPGMNTGAAGEDVGKGEVVLERGAVIGPAEVGMLAALGRAAVPAVRSPRVAVIATGDEIVEPGVKPARGQIRNSNGHALTALARRAGADASYLGIARDRAASLEGKLRRARDADIIVLSGGVSVGDYDLVRDQLRKTGVKPVFWGVRIKPGKPVFFGLKGRRLIFGLPGNPTSAMVTFFLFVRPAVERMLGRKKNGPRSRRALLQAGLVLKPGRLQFLRGNIVGGGPSILVEPFSNQKSGVLRSMVESRVLIVVPPEVSRLEKGQEIDILLMD